MTDLGKLAACAVLSVAVHAVAARTLELLPEQLPAPPPRKIEVRVVEPPPREPPPLPPEPPEPPKPPPPKPVERAPTPRPAAAPEPNPPPKPAAAPTPDPPSDEPAFGFSMESTSQGGNGPAVPVGSLGGSPGGGGGTPPPGPKPVAAAAPIPDYAVTTPPMPQGRCTGKYTDEAKTAGIEGTVVLDLVVGQDGSVHDVSVTQKLGHGLDEAAVAALRACRFTPGEKDGAKVAVRIHGFKIHFVLSDAPQ